MRTPVIAALFVFSASLSFAEERIPICDTPSGVNFESLPSEAHCEKIYALEEGSSTLKFQSGRGSKAVPFVPFKIGEFCKVYDGGACRTFYRQESEIYVQHDSFKNEVFEGTIGAYVAHLNDQERDLNAIGYSLRPEKDNAEEESLANAYEIPTDSSALKSQLLYSLNLDADKVLPNLLGINPKSDCPQLPVPGSNVESSKTQFPLVSIPGVMKMPLDQVVKKFNQQQEVLCSLGLSFFDYVDIELVKEPITFFQNLAELKDKLLSKIGISKFAEVFNMEGLENIATFTDLAKQINDLITGKGISSPEQIFALKDQMNKVIPAEYQIPDVPNIPAPVPPDRQYLDLKKKKTWSGFNIGDKNLFQTYANAYYEIRGSEQVRSATAYGAAGLHILGKEINALGGYADAYAGPDKITADLKFQAFGQDVFPPKHFDGTPSIVVGKPRAWDFDFDKAYSQVFMVGIVPVTVKAGGKINVGVGYEFAIHLTELTATAYPYALASAYASGTAGIPGLLAVGAEADLLLIGGRVPLTGRAAVQFDEMGYPYLKIGLDSKVEIETLKGRVFAYAEYIVPRASLPPWKKKKSTFDLINWKGDKQFRPIMNWGIEIGRNSTKISGDLADQTDRDEANKLDETLKINDRKIEIADLHAALNNKITQFRQKVAEEFTAQAGAGKDPDQNVNLFTQSVDSLDSEIRSLHTSLLLVLPEAQP